MGVNQTNGQFLMKWYRILAMDDDTESVYLNALAPSTGAVC